MDEITVKEYFETKLALLKESVVSELKAQREYTDLKFHASHTALEKAEGQMNERLAKMNEFRDVLKDQASTFVTKNEIDFKMEQIKKELESLKLTRANLEGKASQSSVMIAYIISVIGLCLAILKFFL